MLGGNPDHLRQLADRVRHAAALAGSAAAVLRRTTAVHWSGVAADRFREHLADEGAALARCVDTVLAAADRIADLADTLRTRQIVFLAAEQAASEAVGTAASDAARAVGWADHD